MKKVICDYILLGVGLVLGFVLVSHTASANSVNIDGNFSDWGSVGSVQEFAASPSYPNNMRQVGLFVDEDNIYIYMSMAPKLFSPDSKESTNDYDAKSGSYYLSIGGHDMYVQIYFPGYRPDNSSVHFSVGNIYDANSYKSVNGVGDGYLERQAANGKYNDRWELKIPMATVKEVYGSDLPSQTNITFHGSNGGTIFFNGNVSADYSGASSGPILIAMVGLGMAVISLPLMKKYRLRKNGATI